MNLQKKIIIFNPSIEDGGVEKNLYIITNYLSNKFKEIQLISSNPEKKKKFSKKIKFTSPKNSFWHNKSRLYKYFVCLFLLIKEIILNKNILVLCFQANIYCIIVCKIFKIKIIVRSNTSPSGWSKNVFKRMIFKHYLKKADCIIANSIIFKKQLEKEFKIKVKKIYNPLNIDEIKILSKKKISKYVFNSNKETLKVLNIGRLTDQKDHLTLIKSINLVKDTIPIELIIIGKGANYHVLKKFIKNEGLRKNVKLIGYKKNPYNYIKKCDLFVLTSKYEGLPNVLLEAMYLKKFIISTDCPTGPTEILNKGDYGFLFKVADYKKLSELIINYYYNKNKLKKKINNGYKSLDRFDLIKNCEDYYKLINNYLK